MQRFGTSSSLQTCRRCPTVSLARLWHRRLPFGAAFFLGRLIARTAIDILAHSPQIRTLLPIPGGTAADSPAASSAQGS